MPARAFASIRTKRWSLLGTPLIDHLVKLTPKIIIFAGVLVESGSIADNERHTVYFSLSWMQTFINLALIHSTATSPLFIPATIDSLTAKPTRLFPIFSYFTPLRQQSTKNGRTGQLTCLRGPPQSETSHVKIRVWWHSLPLNNIDNRYHCRVGQTLDPSLWTVYGHAGYEPSPGSRFHFLNAYRQILFLLTVSRTGLLLSSRSIKVCQRPDVVEKSPQSRKNCQVICLGGRRGVSLRHHGDSTR